jgi:hypothetical protein
MVEASRRNRCGTRPITSGWVWPREGCATLESTRASPRPQGPSIRVTVVSTHGSPPSVALTVNGVEWPMMFANPMLIQSVNAPVRNAPKVITAVIFWCRDQG